MVSTWIHLIFSHESKTTIERLSAFDNPVFYKNHNLGFSNWNEPRVIYLGEDVDDYIKIPRGLLETLLNKCHSSNIEYEIIDKEKKANLLMYHLLEN